MILFKKKLYNILFIGADGFNNMILPDDLNTNLITTPWHQRPVSLAENKSIKETIDEYKSKNDISALLVIPQPHVNEVCNSDWLKQFSGELPVGLIWYDYASYYSKVNSMKDNFHIVLDDQSVKTDNILGIWTPIGLESRCPKEERDINVSFFGKIDCNQRKETLKFILNRGIPVFTTGNDWSHVDYGILYNYMSRSKIILNFANNRFPGGDHLQQLKGRVLEAMFSGALVIENVNNQSTKYFKPGEDLVWFENNNDLVEKIQFYLNNNEERIRIAGNGQYLCKTQYTIDNWWRKVVPRLLKFKKIRINVKM
jgi:hypothetical protein